MRLLADQCFDERLAARLRDAGHDVVRVPAQSGLDDLAVAQHAQQEDRVLLPGTRTSAGSRSATGSRARAW